MRLQLGGRAPGQPQILGSSPQLIHQKYFEGCLGGSDGGASDSPSRGPQFKPYTGCSDYLKKKNVT